MFEKINQKHKKEYVRKGITSEALLRRVFPNRYKDYTVPYTLKQAGLHAGNRDIAVLSTVRQAETKQSSRGIGMLVVKCMDRDGTPFIARFIGMSRLEPLFRAYIGSEILLMGNFQYDQIYGYSVFNPDFSQDIKGSLIYRPVYGSIKNIPAGSHQKHIADAVSEKELETIPEEVRGSYPEINRAFRMVHFPENESDASAGQARVILDDIVFFKLRLIQEQTGNLTAYSLRKRESMDQMISRLPYRLTDDQKAAIDGMISQAEGGRRIRALVQGDVGSGKTIVAFCMMACAAENGFPSILMAPTQVLAQQHFQNLISLAGADDVVLIDGTLKGKARQAVEKRVSEGSVKYIIGTSAILTSKINLDRIGLVVIDEEHRFGVEQRAALNSGQAHIITMSATPIPRSLAQTVYGNRTKIYQIRQKPAGRLPVITYYDNGRKILNFLYSRLQEGGQAYVICAAKEDTESMEGVRSVEETAEEYRRLFAPHGFPVGAVTGSMKADEKESVLAAFASGETRILVSTTVVEVGINVPDASVIIIQNAERFGLATLHQLRGRVGRGNRQSYCVLVSESCNNRIRTMCMTNDGFRIAEEDLQERKSGDLLGLRQSGKNRFVEEILSFPGIAGDAERVVSNLNYQAAIDHIEKYSSIYAPAGDV